MKLTELWERCRGSVCAINYLNHHGEIIGAGTGFIVGRYLVTNNHVFQMPVATAGVELHFAQWKNVGLTLPVDPTVFRASLVQGDDEDHWDYAILDIPVIYCDRIGGLELASDDSLAVGSEIAVLGHHFLMPQLTMHTGIISSRYTAAGVRKLQLDASVNPANSGGPLLDVETGRVIGIVTRKEHGLSKKFDVLIQSFDQLIGIFTAAANGPRGLLGNIDPIQSLLHVQQQMRQVALELHRSANVGIGYAYEISRVRDVLNGLQS
ncbi:MAG: trypsin-like peptidase domain-containing protein [Gemmatimonadaceae bacterium]